MRVASSPHKHNREVQVFLSVGVACKKHHLSKGIHTQQSVVFVRRIFQRIVYRRKTLFRRKAVFLSYSQTENVDAERGENASNEVLVSASKNARNLSEGHGRLLGETHRYADAP